MSTVMQINPFDFFVDSGGDALDAGYIWIGQPNLDPRQYPIVVYYDSALTIPAAMPLRTSNGYVVRNGSPTFLYVDGNYSIRVEDSRGRQVFYVPDFLLIGNSTAISVGDITSQDPTKGSGLVGFTQDGTGAVPRNVREKLVEYVTVTDFGAIGDGSDSAAAFVLAANAEGQVVHVPPGNFLVNLTQGNAATIFSMLNRIKVDGFVSIVAPSGLISLTQQVVCNSPDLQRISVVGAAPLAKVATSASVAGSSKNYSVTLTIGDISGVAVNDYAIVRDVSGTGDYYAHNGIWRITSIGVGTITVLNTHHAAAFPTNTVTTATVQVLKSRLQFSGSDGFRFESAQAFSRFDQLAIVGDWSVAAASGTLFAHGIIVCAPVIVGGADSNNTYVPSGNVVAGPLLGVSGFGEQGIAVSGRGHMIANFVASSSNRKRGWYAEGAHIRAKFGIASGNGEDGYISDIGGAIQANSCISVGNGLNGFWCFNNSLLSAPSSRSTGNQLNGYECRGPGRLTADLARAIGNAAAGYSASNGGTISAPSSEGSANVDAGYDATSNATIVATGSSSALNNGTYGFRGQFNSVVNATGATVSGNVTANFFSRDGSVVFITGGTVTPIDIPTYTVGQRLYDADKLIYMGMAVTSLGDLILSSNTTARWSFKSDGTFHPSGDNTQPLGRAANRFSVVFAGTGTINTSDGREKTPVDALTPAEIQAASALGKEIGTYKWLESIKEKGGLAREHVGMTVQRAMEIMQSFGLDPLAYGFICYDEWPAEDEVVQVEEDGSTVVISPAVEAGNRYGFRTDELSLFIAAGLEARISALEAALLP